MYDKKRGKLVLYCNRCNHYFKISEEKFRGVCPKCGEPLDTYRCTRCGHEWFPKEYGKMPKFCAKCRSPYWNRERIREVRK